MNTVRLLLALVYSVSLCLAEGDGWSWPCAPVTEQQNVDIDKLLGRWYYVDWIVISKEYEDHYCHVMNISRTGNSSVLLFQYNETLPSAGHTTGNYSVYMHSPSKWVANGLTQKVVDQSQDGKTLAVSFCHEISATTGVFSRESKVDLAPLHQRLKLAGDAAVGYAEPFDRSGCPFDEKPAENDATKMKSSGAADYWKPSNLYGSLLLMLLSRFHNFQE